MKKKMDVMCCYGMLIVGALTMFANVQAAEQPAGEAKAIASQTITLDGPDWRIATDPKNVGPAAEVVRGAAAGGQADQGAVDHPGRLSGLPRRGLVLAHVHRAGQSPCRRPLPAALLGRRLPGRGVAQRQARGRARGGRRRLRPGCDRRRQAAEAQPAGGPRAQSEQRANRRHRPGRNLPLRQVRALPAGPDLQSGRHRGFGGAAGLADGAGGGPGGASRLEDGGHRDPGKHPQCLAGDRRRADRADGWRRRRAARRWTRRS